MILILINMISLTAIVTQLFVLIMYSLGILFYNFNKTISSSTFSEEQFIRSEESVEYFSQGLGNHENSKETDFTNYDDYSAFSKDSTIEVKPAEIKEQTVNKSMIENTEQSTSDTQKTVEEIQTSDEDYVFQNSVLTATVEDDDFEQITFNLQSEQENSITMATDEDIINVFQKQEPNDWAVRIPKVHS